MNIIRNTILISEDGEIIDKQTLKKYYNKEVKRDELKKFKENTLIIETIKTYWIGKKLPIQLTLKF